jgi:hypothetical protein
MLDPEGGIPNEVARVCSTTPREKTNIPFWETHAYFMGQGCIENAKEYIRFKQHQAEWANPEQRIQERRLQDRRLPAILKEQAS